jgi:protein-arginine kinase activator protein McsA
MLCDQCHQREATVHITSMMPGKPEHQRHFCRVCFPVPEGEPDAAQAERALKLFGDNWSANQNPDDVA